MRKYNISDTAYRRITDHIDRRKSVAVDYFDVTRVRPDVICIPVKGNAECVALRECDLINRG